MLDVVCKLCAGWQFVSPIEDFPIEMYDKLIALNLSAAFHTIRLAVKGMKSRGVCVCACIICTTEKLSTTVL